MEIHRFCAEEDDEVPYEEIANGYETDDGELVVLTDAELATAAPHKTRTIDIEAFVDVEDVDPIYLDHPYVLMPAGDAEGTLRAYRLLVEVDGRAPSAPPSAASSAHQGVPRADPRARRPARADDAALARRGPPDQGDPAPTKQDRPAKKEVDGAVALIEALACPWDPSRYEDDYEKRLKKIIRDKSKGQTIEVPEPERGPAARPGPHGRARGDTGRDHVPLRDSAHR